MKIPESDIEFVKNDAEAAKWLMENLEPRLWQRILPQEYAVRLGGLDHNAAAGTMRGGVSHDG